MYVKYIHMCMCLVCSPVCVRMYQRLATKIANIVAISQY
jgi:hypothetical protein